MDTYPVTILQEKNGKEITLIESAWHVWMHGGIVSMRLYIYIYKIIYLYPDRQHLMYLS